VNTLHRRRGASTPSRLRALFAGCAIAAALTFIQTGLQAADCPPRRNASVPELKLENPGNPKPSELELNINNIKQRLRVYHDGEPPDPQNNAYINDIKVVIGEASAYVTSRAAAVKKPAIVLDIDETSLSNWRNLDVDDFGFVEQGGCSLQPKHGCGFNAWIKRAQATKIAPTLEFYNAVRAKQIAVFFVTGRRDSQRRATIRNLKREGFKDWTGLMTRPDAEHGPIVPFKSGKRAMIEGNGKNWGYTIIANIGDQDSDLAGNDTGPHAECGFKLPNPFYLIP
jgi:acid phosphatase